MPPRYAYWTILVDGQPTAFRAAMEEDLLPTFNRLKQKSPSAEMKWFQNGKLWSSRLEAQEAMQMRGEEFARDLGPLPPTKLHCTQLVEGAIRSALIPGASPDTPSSTSSSPPTPAPPSAGNLNESFNQPRQGGVKVVFLQQQNQQQQ